MQCGCSCTGGTGTTATSRRPWSASRGSPRRSTPSTSISSPRGRCWPAMSGTRPTAPSSRWRGLASRTARSCRSARRRSPSRPCGPPAGSWCRRAWTGASWTRSPKPLAPCLQRSPSPAWCARPAVGRPSTTRSVRASRAAEARRTEAGPLPWESSICTARSPTPVWTGRAAVSSPTPRRCPPRLGRASSCWEWCRRRASHSW
mmetsp:Transcript_38087/g.118400  ORF Transcript_38087/g.118400 Transcript_38087/m.118400 type:complete len:203 (-) Transcript_38087:1104-1712(-)